MTEAEYQSSTHLEALYRFLKKQGLDARTASGRRRLRLLACGCCRLLVWHLPVVEQARRAVEAAEANADGRLKSAGLRAAEAAGVATRPRWYWPFESAPKGPREAMLAATSRRVGTAFFHASRWALDTLGATERAAARGRLCDLVRDVFRFPTRPPLPLPPAVRLWEGGTVIKLAEAAYDQRAAPAGLLDPARLGVLADALEDAGCTDFETLRHLRSPGPHVRGCWALDLILGKK